MSRACSICSHPAAPMIDQALDEGLPYRQLAATFGVSKSALVRHTQHGMPQADHVPGHGTVHEPPRLALAPEAAAVLRREVETLRVTMAQYPHRQKGYYLDYTLGIMGKLIDALSGR